MDLSGFNWGEVILAALSSFVIGYFWYGSLFGKRWKSLLGLTDQGLQKGKKPLIFGLAFLLMFIIAMLISVLIEVVMMLGANAVMGAAFGAVLALLFVATTFGINYLFAGRSFKLYVIDVGYMIVAFAVMGFIMGAWN